MKKKYTYLIVIFLIVASFIAFGRIMGNDFVNFDDHVYITENNHIQAGLSPDTIKWAFTAIVCSNWHPLTLLSHALDWSLFGANASGHHLINLLLHIGSALLLFFLLNRTTKNFWPSAFVAALFALHPLRVESVAWAAERKDVLSMFFGMATLYAYILYVEEHKLSKYFLCLTLFALGLMAKPTLVTLPFVLILLDYWPLGRWRKVPASINMNVPTAVSERSGKKKNKQQRTDSTKEKKIFTPPASGSSIIPSLLWENVPFIFLTIVSSIVTLWAQSKGGAFTFIEHLSFPARVLNAIISYVSYLGKTFWPVDLAVFYPYEYSFPLWQVLASCFILIGITIVVISGIKKLPFLFVGWFWYLGTLIPVIGLVQVGTQAMADRYTYLPSIGIAIMLVWSIQFLFQREGIRKKILFPAGIITLAILAALTWKQCGYWKNSTELFNHALPITKNNYTVHVNLASALAEEGKIEEAIGHYGKAISATAITSYHTAAYNSRGALYAKLGRYQLAMEDYNEAIRLNRDCAECYYNRGTIYGDLGHHQMAIQDYSEAIRLKPDYLYAYGNRGIAYFIQGDNELGCCDANKTCELGDCKILEVAKSKGDCR